MGSDKDFVQAQHALIDPLIEPDPSEETGLNAHFGSTFDPRRNLPSPPGSAGLPKDNSSAQIRHHHTGSTSNTNPFRHSRGSSISKSPSMTQYAEDSSSRRRYDYPSPPNSASPRRDQFSNHRAEAFGAMNTGRPRRSSQPASPSVARKETGLTRGGSLRERYPGDMSHRPLDSLRKDAKTAHRAHHLRKKNFSGADVIDRLDNTTFSYHHEGPYDAANISRNLDWKHSPIAAVQDSNEEALRATPRENILDAVNKHRPLDGVAIVPPGVPDKFGRVYDYQEGTDLMREPGANYKRWPGVEYHPDDLKGKGEPSYTIEKALKDHKKYGNSGTEMTTRRRNQSLGAADGLLNVPVEHVDEANLRRSNTTGKSMGSSLRKRFGSLRRRKPETSTAT